MSAGVDPEARLNLARASVLLVEASQHSADVLAQIVKGFGVNDIHRALTTEEAEKVLHGRSVDLLLVDPSVSDGDGYRMLRDLRHSGGPNAYVPVVLISGHVRASDVARARDTGANFFVTKPITANTLLQRIMFVARDKRPFVQVGDYIGPDRRFKFEGPPPGSDGRRSGDLQAPLGDPAEPNMSQNEIDTIIKPQRVMI
ncbi:MAG: response regulator [Hyphomonadaceae bacterium]|nr:response regulator [Hyphomonadaceae bacterium]